MNFSFVQTGCVTQPFLKASNTWPKDFGEWSLLLSRAVSVCPLRHHGAVLMHKNSCTCRWLSGFDSLLGKEGVIFFRQSGLYLLGTAGTLPRIQEAGQWALHLHLDPRLRMHMAPGAHCLFSVTLTDSPLPTKILTFKSIGGALLVDACRTDIPFRICRYFSFNFCLWQQPLHTVGLLGVCTFPFLRHFVCSFLGRFTPHFVTIYKFQAKQKNDFWKCPSAAYITDYFLRRIWRHHNSQVPVQVE